jgi:hypothetical protein
MERQAEDVMDIDRALERAMEADDPGPAFAGRVIAAISGDSGATARSGMASSRTGRTRVWRGLLPLAATLAVTVAGVQWQAARAEDARARAAHAQLVQALRLTGETLNVVHRAIERSQE